MGAWFPQHMVGAPMPNMDLPFTLNPTQKDGPITSTTVNPYLKPIAAAEAAASAKAGEAETLAHQATVAHDGYEPAFSKIGEATGAWRSVQRLAGKIAAADDQQSSPELTASMHQAKIQVPGIVATAQHALESLLALHTALKADQATKRPDLPPAAHVPDESGSGLGWGALAIGAGIVYLLWKAVF